ncbi:MAG TPA: hypothetical protein DIU00_18700 [Phycisphaerales bacterium]|nr:hypothetical protein [Phycisphaerales bacterium]
MKTDKNSKKLDELISRAIGRDRPEFKFDRWKQVHKKEIEIFKSQTANRYISHPALPYNICRIIMNSKITKIAAAAVMIVGISLSIILLDKTGAPAFGMAEVMAAVAKAEWMHMTWEYDELNTGFEVVEPEIRESWASVNPKRNITVYNNGRINFTEYSTDEIKSQRYDVETNVMTTRYISAGINYPYTSIVELILGDIAELEKRGAAIEYIDSIYDGNPAKVINVDAFDDNSVHFKQSIVVDVKTHLPKRATQISEKLGKSTTANITFDYPQVGPTDIYQAGASRDAKVKVIGQRITPEFLEAIKPYRAARESLPQLRIVVEVENESDNSCVVSVIYTNGTKARLEQLRYMKNDTPPATDDFRIILDWANKAMSDEFGIHGIQLNDGTIVYRADRDYYNPWISEKVSLSHYGAGLMPTGLINRGWPIIRTGTFVENDYAIDNGLLCIESTSEPRFTGDSKLAEAAEKTLYYIDPEHDYMCVRTESFRHPVPPPYGTRQVGVPPIDPINIPFEPYLVTEVAKFSRTDTGHWYPSRIMTTNKQSWSDRGSGWKMREKKFDIRLYVDTDPEFPEGIFDPDSLPR